MTLATEKLAQVAVITYRETKTMQGTLRDTMSITVINSELESEVQALFAKHRALR